MGPMSPIGPISPQKNMQIEIDNGSGFCFGVTTAIKKAEEELAQGETLYCLGDIVHNGMECERLRQMGLVTINHDGMRDLHDVKVLLRAHGEPPATYELARQNNIEIIDATCPVVLKLQKRIKEQYDENLKPQTSNPRLSSLARKVMPRCWDWWDRRSLLPSSSRTSTR